MKLIFFREFLFQINAKRYHDVDNGSVADPSAKVPYFYEPIFFPEDLLPLSHMVIVFSLYSNDERVFLDQLAKIMGAEVQLSFARGSKPLLICPEPKSAKYQAAIRWSNFIIFFLKIFHCILWIFFL